MIFFQHCNQTDRESELFILVVMVLLWPSGFLVVCVFSPIFLPPPFSLTCSFPLSVCLWPWKCCLQQWRNAPADHQLIKLCYIILVFSLLWCQVVPSCMVTTSVPYLLCLCNSRFFLVSRFFLYLSSRLFP